MFGGEDMVDSLSLTLDDPKDLGSRIYIKPIANTESYRSSQTQSFDIKYNICFYITLSTKLYLVSWNLGMLGKVKLPFNILLIYL